jgi:hypothetical protein
MSDSATTKSRLVAIHQPNFFPWLGYFDKIARCDVFVFLDNVQLPRTGAGSWVNRVRLFINGEIKWLTLPIDSSGGGLRPINEVLLAADSRARRKLAESIRHTYRKAPYFDAMFPLINDLLAFPSNNLAEFNIHAILRITDLMGYPRDRFVRSSSLPQAGETSTARLVRIVKEVGGTGYLYGAGAASATGYQDNQLFEQAGIDLIPQNFCHPTYPQFNSPTFQPGLSVIDGLMNCGPSELRRLLDRFVSAAS